VILTHEAGRDGFWLLPPRISESTHDLLSKLGVEVRTGARVAQVVEDGLKLANGEFIPSELVVWSAGVKAPDRCKEREEAPRCKEREEAPRPIMIWPRQ